MAEDLPGEVHPFLNDLLRRKTPAYDSHEIWLEEEELGKIVYRCWQVPKSDSGTRIASVF